MSKIIGYVMMAAFWVGVLIGLWVIDGWFAAGAAILLVFLFVWLCVSMDLMSGEGPSVEWLRRAKFRRAIRRHRRCFEQMSDEERKEAAERFQLLIAHAERASNRSLEEIHKG